MYLPGLLSIVLLLLAGSSAAADISIADRAAEFISSAPGDRARTRSEQRVSVDARFDELGLEQALEAAATYDATTADSLFRAAQHAFFYTAEERYLQAMERMLASLEQARAATPQHYTMWYRALIQARRFADARQVRAAHATPQMAALPEQAEAADIAPGLPSVWKVESANRIVRSPMAYEHLKLIVVSHPGCGYTRRAAADIENDPVLARIFETGALWLAPQDANLNAEAFWRWNQSHPTLPIAIVHRADELPAITRWATPTFYFLDRGRVIGEVVGWPEGGRRDELIAAAKKAGLLPAE